jgi:hypothetical protein
LKIKKVKKPTEMGFTCGETISRVSLMVALPLRFGLNEIKRSLENLIPLDSNQIRFFVLSNKINFSPKK